MSTKPKCYRCGREGGFASTYYACQRDHCSMQGQPICDDCLRDQDAMGMFSAKKCPWCKVGHMKSVK